MIAVIKRRAGRWALNGAAAIGLLYILTPLIFVTWLAFFRQEIPSFPPEGYSLRWFAAILDQPKFVNGFSLSFCVGLLATLIGLALGVPAALCVARLDFTLRAPLSAEVTSQGQAEQLGKAVASAAVHIGGCGFGIGSAGGVTLGA